MTATRPPAPPRKPRTGAIITLIIGAILTVSGPILGVLAGSFAMIPGTLEVVGGSTQVSPTGIVALDADESVYLLAPVGDLERVDQDACTVSGPDGETTTVAFAPASALNTLVGWERYESFALVTATVTGAHDITCQTDDIPVITAPPFNLDEMFGPLAWWSLIGIVVSLIGVVTVIIGIVRLTRTRTQQ